MPEWIEIVGLWFGRLFSAALIVLTALPMIRSGWWFVRVCDFPRLQLGSACAAAALAVLWLVPGAEGIGWSVGTGLAAVLQFSHVAPFVRLWPAEVRSVDRGPHRLVTANLDVRNRNCDACVRALGALDADLLLLIEVSEAWHGRLEPLRERYPHRVEHVADEGLGLVLWSKHQLHDPGIRFLVSKNRPSIAADVELEGGRPVRLRGLHPTPPGLPVERDPPENEEGKSSSSRHDSRIRDAELILIADEAADEPDSVWVVSGDFNDVAWSRTTRLFKRISGLLDPRVGRGLLNTYHARYPLLRYPLDHVMVSPEVRVARIERVRIPGSDHFGVVLDFAVEHESADAQEAHISRSADAGEPQRIVESGRADSAGPTGGSDEP